MVSPEDRIAVGRITHAHGIHGEVAVLVLSEVKDRFGEGSSMHAEDGRPLTVESARPHRGRLLVKFREVPDRIVAETLQGQYAFVSASEVPELPEGSFWPHELLGCEVVTETGRLIGRITEVIHGEANDVWIAREEDRETLVPALKDVVLESDLAARRVVVREVPGLTTDEQ